MILMAVSCQMGYMKIPLQDVVLIIMQHIGLHDNAHVDPASAAVVMEIRLPRIIGAAMVGGALAVSGTVFQALLLNPLADPYTLGISSGAAFGACIAIVLTLLGIAMPQVVSIPVLAFAGAMASLFAVMTLAYNTALGGMRKFSSTNLILSGVIISAILSAAIGFMKFLADEQVGAIIFWLMGSFSSMDWSQTVMISAVSAPLLLLISCYGQDLNIIATGEKNARGMGVNVSMVRVLLLSLCSLWTAMAVSISGIIGFVGLIVPHLLRYTFGPDNRFLLSAAFPAGAMLLLCADTLTRAVLPAEVPIGVLTALIGGPFFCLIFKRYQSARQI